VDVFQDEEGFIWVGVHFGSRGLGHGIASGFLSLSQGKMWGDRVPESETLLDLRSSLGEDYWALMNLAGEYAYAGREWVARKVVEILKAKEVEMVHNHHNFAWKERVFVGDMENAFTDDRLNQDNEVELIVVRKGATPAFPGQKGFVGGSMGDTSVILEGRDSPKMAMFPWRWNQIEALNSTVHGAGRVMSRTEAAGKRDRKTGELKLDKETGLPVKPPKVTPEMQREWLAKKGVILRGGGVDESPHCYRRLPEVLESQRGTVEILHKLEPLIVVMAGEDVYDPFKD
jgi:tRNA-splicing ligase RtcB (3'-phosphate/5'-hydroxy nucleic acid ligase)